jgi:hypothetical protein
MVLRLRRGIRKLYGGGSVGRAPVDPHGESIPIPRSFFCLIFIVHDLPRTVVADLPQHLWINGPGSPADGDQLSETYAMKSSESPGSLHRIPPPKESMKVLRESLLIDENTGSGAVRYSSGGTGLHIVVAQYRRTNGESNPRCGNPAQPAHGASVSIGAMPPASFQHCSGICIRIARGCRFITHNQIHNQSYLNIYLPCKSPDRGC